MTILVIGAHQDDCELGAGGLIVKASRKGHQVVLVNTCSGYSSFSNWCVTKGREKQFIEKMLAKAKEMGVEKRLLDYSDADVITDMETRRKVARDIAEITLEIKPDIILFPSRFETRPPDHGIVGKLAEDAVFSANEILGGQSVSYGGGRGEMYAYEIYLRPSPPYPLFQPDIYIDISDVIKETVEPMNFFAQLYAESEHGKEAGIIESKVKINYLGEEEIHLTHYGEIKLTLSRYRGFQCGVRYAEAYRAINTKVLGERFISRI